MVWNPYKTNSKIGPDIKSFCKPIHMPKATVQNPYAKDAKSGGHTHSFAGSIFLLGSFGARLNNEGTTDFVGMLVALNYINLNDN